MTRSLENWIEAFIDYTEFVGSPRLFRQWCAIACVAGVMERKVWVHTRGSNLYPNLYVILVAPPGVGKSQVTVRVEQLWAAMPDQHFVSGSLSRASFGDVLKESTRTVVRPRETPSTILFNSLKVLSNELAVLLPTYENDFMASLTDVYDCSSFSERKRGGEVKYRLEAPQVTLLAGTTPAQLSGMLPEGAWEQGFLSRTILVYSGKKEIMPIFTHKTTDAAVYKELLRDLKSIATQYGQMVFSPEAAKTITDWHMADGPPRPEHPKLLNYCARRTAHVLKLCMVSAAASGSSMTIERDHVEEAVLWLLEAESFMPDIFKSMSTSNDSKVIEECWYFTLEQYMLHKAPVPEAAVFGFVQARVPAHSVERIVTVMEKAGLLQVVNVNKLGKCYKPKPRVSRPDMNAV